MLLKDMKKLDGKLKYTRKDFLYKLSTEMSVKNRQLFQRLDKFLGWLRIENYREVFSEEQHQKIPEIFRIDLQKNTVAL